MCNYEFSEADIREEIKENNYGEKEVLKLLDELERDTGDYCAFDNAMAIIYYMDLYNDLLKEYNKRVATIIRYEQVLKESIDEFEELLGE